MSSSNHATAGALSDYDLEIITVQKLCLDMQEVDDICDFFKLLSVRILKYPETLEDPEVVGEATGVVVLSCLAGNEGYELRDIFDQHSEELLSIHDTLLEGGIELPTWEDLIVLSEISIVPKHQVPGMGMAVFQQLIRTIGAELNVGLTYESCLGLELSGRGNGSQRVALPEGMRRVPGSELVLWTGDRLSTV